MIDINKRYKTKSGNPVRIYTIDGLNVLFPVVGEIIFPTLGGSQPYSWTRDGEAPARTYTPDYNLEEVTDENK